jgi:hypothetical protein
MSTAGVKRLLFIGVGCQVQALRSVEKYLGLEKLYVLGTNCVDNGRCVYVCAGQNSAGEQTGCEVLDCISVYQHCRPLTPVEIRTAIVYPSPLPHSHSHHPSYPHVLYRRGTLEKFLNAASSRPQDVLHYEFMQDYRVRGARQGV